jgi:prepilin-type N-terminal cleavage/methylation domain-containing protein
MEAIWRRARERDGFTLSELLAASALTLVVASATLYLLETSSNDEKKTAAWATQVQLGQATLERMAHDVRSATVVVAADYNFIQVMANVPVNGTRTPQVIDYSCGPQSGTNYIQCVRRQASSSAGLSSATGQTILTNLENGTSSANPIFSCVPANCINPTYIGIKAVMPASGELAPGPGHNNTVVLDDGAYLRNPGVGA